MPSDESKSWFTKRRMMFVLKLAGLLAPAIFGAVGSWYKSRSDLEAGYHALASTTKDLERAVQALQENEKRLWDIALRSLPTPRASALEPLPIPLPATAPAASTPRHIPVRPAFGSGSVHAARDGRTHVEGFGIVGSGVAAAPTKSILTPIMPNAPVQFQVRKAPLDLNSALSNKSGE